VSDNPRDLVRIQYPTADLESLQLAVVQIKQLLEDPEFYRRLAEAGRKTYLEGSDTTTPAALFDNLPRTPGT